MDPTKARITKVGTIVEIAGRSVPTGWHFNGKTMTELPDPNTFLGYTLNDLSTITKLNEQLKRLTNRV